MKLVEARYDILSFPESPLLSIETAARTCYKSEDRITPGSAEVLVKSLISRGHHAMLEFGGMAVVRFTSNRGFSHEMVRMRLCSFAQESSRYCNYSKGKFDREITCCVPLTSSSEERSHFFEAWREAERRYMNLISLGVAPELARDVLPIGLKTEIVVAANTREWRHVFEQRCSPKAHPRMRELMVPLLAEFKRRTSVLFDDLEP